jgi:TfoX/Sxy family transcriptional regulator of competence genes
VSTSDLPDRIRATLAPEPSTREVPMFGGLSFMVNTKMVVAAQKDGSLLVRVDPERSDELLAHPGAEPAEMGAGRAMGPGLIRVRGDILADDADLSFWIGVAMEYNTR